MAIGPDPDDDFSFALDDPDVFDEFDNDLDLEEELAGPAIDSVLTSKNIDAVAEIGKRVFDSIRAGPPSRNNPPARQASAFSIANIDNKTLIFGGLGIAALLLLA